jgi:hypothetical protein
MTLTTAYNQLNSSFQTHHNTITLENIKLEKELHELKDKHSNDLIKYGGVAVTSFTIGMFVNRCWPSLFDTFITWLNGFIKDITAGSTGTRNLQPGGSHPDIPYIYSGINPGTATPGTFYSGLFPTAHGEVQITGFNTIPNQQDDVIQPDPSEVNVVTNPSGSQCSGTFVSSHLENIPPARCKRYPHLSFSFHPII